MIKLRNLFFGLLIVFLSSSVSSAAQTVRVGVYENKPKIFTGTDGKPQGIFIDIIEAIAEKEGWILEYVSGTWAEGLQRLETSEIDLMPDVLFSQEREKLYDFNTIVVVSEWMVFYTRKDILVESFNDLEGRVVAVLAKSIQETTINKILPQLGIKCTILTLPDYPAVVQALINGKADAIMANRFFPFSGIDTRNIITSDIVTTPTGSFFATAKGAHPNLLARIDKHMSLMKNNPDSVYYTSLQKWLREPPQTIIPPFLKWISLSFAIGLFFVFVWVVLLKKQSAKQRAAIVMNRIASEQTLKESEASLRKAQEIANMGSWEYDLVSGETTWSENYFVLYGLEPFSVKPSFSDFMGRVYPEDQHLIDEGYERILRERNPVDIEMRIVLPDGEIRSILNKMEPSFDGEKLVKLQGVNIDITERKKTEEFIKNIFDSMGESLVVISPDFRVVHANRAFFKMFSITPEDLSQKHCYEVFQKTDRPCKETGIACPVMHSFENGTQGFSLDTYTNDKGEPFYTETRTFPMKNESGKTVSVIRVITDITDRKKLENQIRHSQKMEAIGTLTGGVAHDFNNILNVIMGFSSIVLESLGKDSTAKDHMDEVLKAAERATELTRKLLIFSRKQRIELKPVDLNMIISELNKMLLRIIGEDIKLIVDLTGEEMIIMADEGQIEQVLMNLAANARDAMPEGGDLSIRTGLRELDADFFLAHGYGRPGKYAAIWIADTGVGIDADKKDKIFEPFFTTKAVGEGTGLGLSIAYEIIKQHNGYINVYSEKGKGTTFTILLPLANVTAETRKEFREIAPLKGGDETVLIAEDDAAVRKITKTILESYGYNVIAAEDGEDGIAKFLENKDSIQLVISDLIMPRKKGQKMYEEIRETNPGIKVLFMSGYSSDFLSRKEITKQGLEFLAKPVSPRALLLKVREILDK